MIRLILKLFVRHDIGICCSYLWATHNTCLILAVPAAIFMIHVHVKMIGGTGAIWALVLLMVVRV